MRVTLISIPYGAIKSEYAAIVHEAVNQISIPYGAIKRINQISNVCKRLFISIPYGAIKSGKVIIPLRIFIQISIPYGAIKRRNIFSYEFRTNTFQFLMVRLKGAVGRILFIYDEMHFNSLWCD
mgnify:CR=1 FL=1